MRKAQKHPKRFGSAFAKASSFAEAAADKTADKKGLEKDEGVFLLR